LGVLAEARAGRSRTARPRRHRGRCPVAGGEPRRRPQRPALVTDIALSGLTVFIATSSILLVLCPYPRPFRAHACGTLKPNDVIWYNHPGLSGYERGGDHGPRLFLDQARPSRSRVTGVPRGVRRLERQTDSTHPSRTSRSWRTCWSAVLATSSRSWAGGSHPGSRPRRIRGGGPTSSFAGALMSVGARAHRLLGNWWEEHRAPPEHRPDRQGRAYPGVWADGGIGTRTVIAPLVTVIAVVDIVVSARAVSTGDAAGPAGHAAVGGDRRARDVRRGPTRGGSLVFDDAFQRGVAGTGRRCVERGPSATRVPADRPPTDKVPSAPTAPRRSRRGSRDRRSWDGAESTPARSAILRMVPRRNLPRPGLGEPLDDQDVLQRRGKRADLLADHSRGSPPAISSGARSAARLQHQRTPRETCPLQLVGDPRWTAALRDLRVAALSTASNEPVDQPVARDVDGRRRSGPSRRGSHSVVPICDLRRRSGS